MNLNSEFINGRWKMENGRWTMENLPVSKPETA